MKDLEKLVAELKAKESVALESLRENIGKGGEAEDAAFEDLHKLMEEGLKALRNLK